MLHNEADGIAAFATTKTFINFLTRRYGKRRSFFIVKRTKAKVAGTSFFQFYKLANDVHNIDATEDLLYGILTYQCID